MSHLEAMRRQNAEFADWRQDLHAHPELAFEERRTSMIVAEKLQAWGYEVATDVGRTGVVGSLRAGTSRRAVAIRADMDALPIVEKNGFAHVSRHPGSMHACGHDGHTVMLLAAARHLAQAPRFNGTVHLIFQPAEESCGGAQVMLEDGLLERFPADAAFAMHNAPGLPVGQFAVNPGAMAAACDIFRVQISGRSGHGGFPELTRNPVTAAAELASKLEALSTRGTGPASASVLTVTTIQGGTVPNAVAEEAMLAGAVRAFDTATRAAIEAAIGNAVAQIATARDVKGALTYTRGACPPCLNSPLEAAFARDVARGLAGAENVVWDFPPLTFSEDFAFILERIRGAYILIGNGDGPERPMVHSANYDFNDDAIPFGASFWIRLVEMALPA